MVAIQPLFSQHQEHHAGAHSETHWVMGNVWFTVGLTGFASILKL